MKSPLEQLLLVALRQLVGTRLPALPDDALVSVERARDAGRGEFASNVAMRLAKAAGKDARELAQDIVAALPASPLVSRVEIAGPGFINFHLGPAALAGEIRRIHEMGATYGRGLSGAGQRVVVGVVVESPAKPLDMKRGRQAAYSDALSNVLVAAGHDVRREASVEAPAVQGVALYRGKERVQLSTLHELREEIGNDACRFFFLLRSHEQPLDLDLKLATSRTNENPMYYVQYVHARVASVMKEIKARGISFELRAALENLHRLDRPTEQALIGTLLRFPSEVEAAAANCAPHSIVYYLRDVANAFHTYYNAEKWMVEETDLRSARLALVLAAGHVVRNGLELLGVSTPESM